MLITGMGVSTFTLIFQQGRTIFAMNLQDRTKDNQWQSRSLNSLHPAGQAAMSSGAG